MTSITGSSPVILIGTTTLTLVLLLTLFRIYQRNKTIRNAFILSITTLLTTIALTSTVQYLYTASPTHVIIQVTWIVVLTATIPFILTAVIFEFLAGNT